MNIITTLSSFAVVGVLVGLVIEYTKTFFTSATATQRTLYALLLSLIGGAIVYFWHLIPGSWITDGVGVIAAVNTAYVFIIQYLPNTPTASVSATPASSTTPQ